jgi:cholesterol oxidase
MSRWAPLSDFADTVGIRFREIMSGFVAEGAADPVQGERVGRETGQDFSYDLGIEIPSLNEFLGSRIHEAMLGDGSIKWSQHMGEAQVPGGTCILFRTDESDSRRKFFDFRFEFPDGDSGEVEVEGHKYLFDDGRLDAAADLSTVFLQLRRSGAPLAAGVVRVHVIEFLRQLQSMKVTGTDRPSERTAALKAFFAFMNDELRQIYRGFPRIVHA